MLTCETLVQIHKSGLSVPAGELDVGDFVFDNFAGRYREISSLKRSTVNATVSPELAPVPIRWGVLGHGIPMRDVVVSPDQKFLSVVRPKDAIPYIQAMVARDLKVPVWRQSNGQDVMVDYVALFFDGSCYVVCSDLLMFGYTPEIFTAAPHETRRRA